jgi:outer membrane protein
MKKLLVLVCATAAFSMATGNATADSINGKLGVTGKLGVQIPSNGDIGPNRNETDAGFVGGVGLIYGIDNHFAAEIGISHSELNSDFGHFGVTDFALGAQYRFVLDQHKLVPYAGTGLDLLVINADHGRNVGTTAGVHFSGGVDYFIMKQLALTAEARVVAAPDANINGPNGERGHFDPTSFSTTFGARYFFN